MIKGDSADYKLLAKWANQLSALDFTVSVEIGVRQGYGTQVIMENLPEPNFHIGIDPYGDIKYKHVDEKEGTAPYWKDANGQIMVDFDGSFKVPTYPNTMKQDFLEAFKKHDNFILHQLEDTEYFNAFGNGVPIYYQGTKRVVNTYDFVFFDGPHTTEAVMNEAMFFANRSRVGTRFVFDDHDTYRMDLIAHALTFYKFKTIETGETKICLERQT